MRKYLIGNIHPMPYQVFSPYKFVFNQIPTIRFAGTIITKKVLLKCVDKINFIMIESLTLIPLVPIVGGSGKKY